MFQAIQSVGSMALPYLIQAGKDFAKSYISRSLANTKQTRMKVLGQCADKLIDTIGNKRDAAQFVRGRGVARSAPRRQYARSSSQRSRSGIGVNRRPQMIEQQGNQQYIQDMDNTQVPQFSLQPNDYQA